MTVSSSEPTASPVADAPVADAPAAEAELERHARTRTPSILDDGWRKCVAGITSAEDALKFLMAGAVAVQVGTMTFANPSAMVAIIDGLADYCERERLGNLQEIVGIL